MGNLERLQRIAQQALKRSMERERATPRNERIGSITTSQKAKFLARQHATEIANGESDYDVEDILLVGIEGFANMKRSEIDKEFDEILDKLGMDIEEVSDMNL